MLEVRVDYDIFEKEDLFFLCVFRETKHYSYLGQAPRDPCGVLVP